MMTRNIKSILSIFISIFLLVFLVILAHWEAEKEVLVDWPPPRLEMKECINSLNELIKTNNQNNDIAEIIGKMEACQYQLHTQGILDDFQLRRSKFYQQNYADTIILWMVVFITISGILLAALQLLISYRLAAAAGNNLGDMGGELSLEKGKVSLKSSLSGIFILVISFAFFWLFVNEVYHIKTVNPDGEETSSKAISDNTKLQTQHNKNLLEPGGVGKSPKTK